MRPEVFTWDGNAINSGSYRATFSSGTNFFQMGETVSKLLARSGHPPVIADVEIKPRSLELVISFAPGTNFTDKIDEINQWFNTRNTSLKKLVIKDLDDSSRQWYLWARPETQPFVEVGRTTIRLIVPDPIWQTVTANTDTWTPVATGATKTITCLGNHMSRPKSLKIKYNTAKSEGAGAQIFRVWRNPLVDTPVMDDALDIMNAAWDTAAIISNSSVSNQVNKVGGILAGDLTIPVDTAVGGGLSTGGGLCYVVSTGEQIYYTGISGGNMAVYNVGGVTGRGWGGTTAAGAADNAVIRKSGMLANGNDVRVYRDNRPVPFWIGNINAANTKVWVECDYRGAMELTLNLQITGAGDIASIEVAVQDWDKLDKIFKAGIRMVSIDSEIFSFTDVDKWTRTFTGTVKRGLFGSTKVTHTKSTKVYPIEHYYKITYNNPLESAVVQSEVRKPMFALTSTNASRNYTEFTDDSGLRLCQFRTVTRWGKNVSYYTATHGGEADPSTDLGFMAKPYGAAGSPHPDTYYAFSYLYHPAGFDNITCNGDVRREDDDWADSCGIYGGSAEMALSPISTISSPGSKATWTAWSKAAVALNNKTYIGFGLNGDISGRKGNVHYFEVQTISSVVLRSAGLPQLVYSSAEQGAVQAKPRLYNDTQGIFIDIDRVVAVGQYIEIDCEAQTAVYLEDNTQCNNSIKFPKRTEMFFFGPGANTLRIVEAGLTSATLDFSWYDRNL